MALTKPPYTDIGNPKMRANPIVEQAYPDLDPDLQIIAEIFDLSDFNFPPDKIMVLPGPWYWMTI